MESCTTASSIFTADWDPAFCAGWVRPATIDEELVKKSRLLEQRHQDREYILAIMAHQRALKNKQIEKEDGKSAWLSILVKFQPAPAETAKPAEVQVVELAAQDKMTEKPEPGTEEKMTTDIQPQAVKPASEEGGVDSETPTTEEKVVEDAKPFTEAKEIEAKQAQESESKATGDETVTVEKMTEEDITKDEAIENDIMEKTMSEGADVITHEEVIVAKEAEELGFKAIEEENIMAKVPEEAFMEESPIEELEVVSKESFEETMMEETMSEEAELVLKEEVIEEATPTTETKAVEDQISEGELAIETSEITAAVATPEDIDARGDEFVVVDIQDEDGDWEDLGL
ncbi:hypothetical protein B0T16DRAFT_513251 [Cercophora newfieldiana]|uniref:Uncharacterized protein n=1 Tax=Cercophora newfieldiana TaxID=92897 RepID=A0AA39Y1Y6_9PEZI|nr:hypothetical protein B0T16DRAFT_513251 [Cercophora newfieldiana]